MKKLIPVTDYKYANTNKNSFINELLSMVDDLRTAAYQENQIEWFHRMNELSIWLSQRFDYEEITTLEWVEEEVSEAIITM